MAEFDVSNGFMETLGRLPNGDFSTADFIICYRAEHPEEWKNNEIQYGVGGKGAGQHHTVFTRVAHALSKLARKGELNKLDYRAAPDWWGNEVVQYWNLDSHGKVNSKPENTVDEEYREGSLSIKVHLVRERARGLSKKKKDDFRKKHGKLICERCNLDPEKEFGQDFGDSVIEVHHAKVSVGSMNGNHRTKLSDLECLCANCHRLTHAEMNAKLSENR